ncbi:hybrid sensor histidine kinase/response regulator [Pseudomonas syringae group genomosp. 3]|uniref:histidine kinase n=1 Tax=Pseudomonas syringae pv. tomato (strain ATCC BAA-871 / DC3000) TaxID=223283 RepID=Q888W6_PSESM|nr:hybrid sensor histidine kinase/response regulator [Pseudomonas syringae group genomosp. 3]AAO54432.1 sensor histidine kinase/response regulator [Pseudomonas syringae pv. tomato str. DC3000]KKI24633.1 histidine kinase [Pseudomonas syringae pv. persicae]KPB91845.1 Sensor histidine kinase/response regulator [Pseudomonas syringae pv. maculicola]KPY87185.1 Sensor histidine kinase/response regulator [Pseudomonas syringae pv. tomato]MBF9244531.1 response regulator [Pseudomonas syringae pv. tomato]
MKDRKNAELDQATLRLIVATFAISYVSLVGFLPGLNVAKYQPIILYYAGFLVVSLVLRQHIISYPGVYAVRRVLGMVHDYTGISVGLIVGGEATLPIFSVMVWVTLGNGMRYGSRYLAIAASLALLAILIIYQLTPYWQAQPFMVLMLVAVTILVPGYAHILLVRTREASEQATVATREKERFLAQASHDLRQPIHSIGMFTACLRSSPLGDYERQLVDNIDRSLHNVSQLFRTILDIYTLDSGKVFAKSDLVHLGEMLNEIAQQNTAAARWAGVDLRVRPCRRWARVDATLLATMVQNILSNALKYAPEHPVLIGVRRNKGGLSISVHDRGRGIAAEHLPRVCEEFYRIRHARDKDVEGVGLGLSIVKRLSQILGVKINIESEVDRGTTVTIHGLEEVSAPVQRVRKKPLGDSLLKGVRICLVEDDNNVLMATAALLERWGCEVQTARSAQGLITDCDIIVADYDLGTAANGLDCIESIRAARGWDVPALIVTGREVEVVLESLQGAEVSVLSKPLRPSELRLNLLSVRERRVNTP